MSASNTLGEDYWDTFYTTSDWGEPRQEALEVAKGLQNLFRTKSIRVLDLGCGNGRYAIPFAELGAFVDCVDLSRVATTQLLEKAKQKGLAELLNIHNCDVRQYTIKIEYYQLVFASGLFEYLSRLELAELISRIQVGTKVKGVNYFVFLLQHPQATVIPGEYPLPAIETVTNLYPRLRWKTVSSQCDLKEDDHPIEAGSDPKRHKHYVGRVALQRLA